MKNQKKETGHRLKFAGLGAAIGLVFGGLVGFLIGNPIVFAGGVMVLGLALGAAFDQRREE
jgi:hypothetical protein